MANDVFRVSPQVVIESFDDGALVLHLEDRHLSELNTTARDVIDLTNGQRSVEQVVSTLADKYQVLETEMLQAVIELYEQLGKLGIAELVNSTQDRKENPKMAQVFSPTDRYLWNPDVVMREEDEDGGLLFNPDTSQVKVINASGLFIWKQCDGMHDLASIAAALQQSFEDAPADAVVTDVQAFLEDLLTSGFIGTVLPDCDGDKI